MPFGIGILAENDNGDVRPRRIATVGAQSGGPSAGRHRRTNPFIDRGGAGKIRVGVLRALPCQSPTARLFLNIVRAVSGDQDARLAPQRQQAVFIF
jgi:hypothetical protein